MNVHVRTCICAGVVCHCCVFVSVHILDDSFKHSTNADCTLFGVVCVGETLPAWLRCVGLVRDVGGGWGGVAGGRKCIPSESAGGSACQARI